MTGKTHTSIGVASALIAISVTGLDRCGITTVGACCVLAATASTLPDIDTGAAKKVYRGAVIGMLVCSMAALFMLLFNSVTLGKSIVNLLGLGVVSGWCLFAKERPHREFTHSFVSLAILLVGLVLVMSGIVWEKKLCVLVAFASAYLSHLLIDAPNKKGEQLLWPLPKRFCLKLCSANGYVNDALFVIGSVVSLAAIGGMLK